MIKSYKVEKIETERLIIDKGSIDDYLKVYEFDLGKLRDIAGVFKYEKQDPNEVREWFKGDMSKFYRKKEREHIFNWIIYLKEGNIPIGEIMADREDLENKEIEIAYNLHPTYWGNGYMVESMTDVINFLFELGYENIICTYSEGNKKSKRVCEKLDFDFYKVMENVRIVNGIKINDYVTIMTKKKWYNIEERRNEFRYNK